MHRGISFSIITTSYNSAATILDTFASVQAQSHRPIEHIVIDGGSTDGTVDIVRSHAQHVSHFVSERDAGIYDAMNKGLRLATGDWVGFLNSDDMLADSQVLEKVARVASEDPDVNVIYGDLVFVSPQDTSQVVRRWRSSQLAGSMLRRGWMPPHPTFYVRRDLLAAGDLFDTGLRISADYDFMLKVLLKPTVRARFLPLTMVRMRAGGVSNGKLSSALRKLDEDYRAIRRHMPGHAGVGTLLMKRLRKIPQLWSR